MQSRKGRTPYIIDTERDTLVVAEIKLGEIPL
jgi:hypothetical protein